MVALQSHVHAGVPRSSISHDYGRPFEMQPQVESGAVVRSWMLVHGRGQSIQRRVVDLVDEHPGKKATLGVALGDAVKEGPSQMLSHSGSGRRSMHGRDPGSGIGVAVCQPQPALGVEDVHVEPYVGV